MRLVEAFTSDLGVLPRCRLFRSPRGQSSLADLSSSCFWLPYTSSSSSGRWAYHAFDCPCVSSSSSGRSARHAFGHPCASSNPSGRSECLLDPIHESREPPGLSYPPVEAEWRPSPSLPSPQAQCKQRVDSPIPLNKAILTQVREGMYAAAPACTRLKASMLEIIS